MLEIKKSELTLIGHWKGISQYEVKRRCRGNEYPQRLIVFELSDTFYLQTYNLEDGDLRNQILDTLLYCYDNHYDTACLGIKIEVTK